MKRAAAIVVVSVVLILAAIAVRHAAHKSVGSAGGAVDTGPCARPGVARALPPPRLVRPRVGQRELP